jgi:hypothetical protein
MKSKWRRPYHQRTRERDRKRLYLGKEEKTLTPKEQGVSPKKNMVQKMEDSKK